MGLFSSRSNRSGDWEASTTRAPRDSAGRGTHNGIVNGEVVAGNTTRRKARQAARSEARRRGNQDGRD